MSYISPEAVQGPKKRVSNVRVVYDGGPGGGAVCELEWEGEPGVAIRWTGEDDWPLGNPQSRGNPTWFLVPAEFQEVVLQRARDLAPESEEEAGYRAMAADTEREAEALDWSNALIGDTNRAAG
ncbi:hypothetical protein [uncultured Lamprocystis sp.]|jgi:hypothetical protein|uniref:hypothetical protein n=1 Tax=uncultured Lamprocystis sp. TaxID=543132 RepID=UPI0026001131|nr:hypothetical protein [uncultured Lamprocystis sp.]